MSEGDGDRKLRRLAARTEGLAGAGPASDEVVLRIARESTCDLDADPSFSDAVLARVAGATDDAEAFERIAVATSDLAPDAALAGAVVAAAAAEVPAGPGRLGRFALVAAAAVAASSIAYATYAQSAFDAGVMATIDSIEVSE